MTNIVNFPRPAESWTPVESTEECPFEEWVPSPEDQRRPVTIRVILPDPPPASNIGWFVLSMIAWAFAGAMMVLIVAG